MTVRSRSPRGAAVFDLDNTHVPGSSLFHFGVAVARQRRIPLQHVVRFAATEASYVWRRTEPQCIAPSVAERTLGLDAGMRQTELLGLVLRGPAKEHRVAEVVAEHGLDPQASGAFIDSVNDLPLLRMVGNPVATNPDPELTAIARRNGWPVLGGHSGGHQWSCRFGRSTCSRSDSFRGRGAPGRAGPAAPRRPGADRGTR